jgi:hypothetical protein
MKLTLKIALAAVLVSAAAAPALADDWQYRGGPKGPQSLSGPWYSDDYAHGGGYYGDSYYGGGPYAYYGASPYAAYGGYGYYARPAYRSERLYNCRGPATSDCYNYSRQLQGTR